MLLTALTVIASASFAGSVGGKVDTQSTSEQGTMGPVQGAATLMILSVEWGFDQEPPAAFEIKDFSFGVENPTTIGSATGGAGAGKIKFNEFSIKKATDKTSPVFFKTCANGQHIDTMVLAIMKVDPNGRASPYMTYKFETAFTTKIDWSGPGDEGPEESITFVYGKLGVTYHQFDARAGTSTDVEFGWDQVENKET